MKLKYLKLLLGISLFFLAGHLLQVTGTEIRQTKSLTISGQISTPLESELTAPRVEFTTLGDNLKQSQRTPVDSNGKFKIQVNQTGIYTILITAVNHYPISIPVVVSELGRPVEIKVILRPYQYYPTFNEIKIIGDWNRFNLSQAEKMQPQADGAFVYEGVTTSETVRYQIIGAVEGLAVNGTMADSYEYDNHGGYHSVIRVKPGPIRIVFDPAKLKNCSAKNLPGVSFNKKYKNLETIFAISNLFADTYQDYKRAQSKYREENETGAGFRYDSSDLKSYLKEVFQNGEDITVRQTAALFIINLYKIGQRNDPELFKEILEVFPPNSLLWSMDPYAAVVLSKSFPVEKAGALLQEFLETNPSKQVQARALATLALDAKTSGMTARFQKLYEELKRKYGDLSEIQSDLKRLNPDQKIDKGKQVPGFKAQLLDSDTIVTNGSLSGKYYLIDFWASWCGACRDELPALHRAYEKYQNAEFEILSLSLDQSREDVQKFREGQWKLPWLHGFLEGGFSNQMVREFEISSLPMLILAGPDGKIIAAGNELRGDGLERILARYLKPAVK